VCSNVVIDAAVVLPQWCVVDQWHLRKGTHFFLTRSTGYKT
jgi:hypothetical protein